MSNLRKIQAVLFDLDGTLVDSLPGIQFSVDSSLAACGLPPRTRELRSLIGPPIRTILNELLPQVNDEQLSRLESAFRISYDSVGWRKTLLHAGAVETLTKLKAAGSLLFLITNKPVGPTRQLLEEFRLRHLFTQVLSQNSRTPPFRSKQEMLREITRVQGLNPEACLYVGDTAEDFRAATDIGIPVAMVAYGYGEPDLNQLCPACINLFKLRELLNFVEARETAS